MCQFGITEVRTRRLSESNGHDSRKYRPVSLKNPSTSTWTDYIYHLN